MKKTVLLVLAIITSQLTQAQTPLTTAIPDVTLQCAGAGSNRTGVAFNPNQELYYSVSAGTIYYQVETFDIGGTQLATVDQGFDYRGVWWNPNTGVLEGNGYHDQGIRIQNLDVNFYALGTGTISIPGAMGPQSQSSADYDSNADEILYYYDGSIYRFDRVTHTLITSTVITGLPVTLFNLNNNSVVYTGVSGSEIGVYDYVNKALYLINKTTGAYVMTCQLPVTAPATDSFKMGFANGRLWLFDQGTMQWKGYVVIGCDSTSSNITVTECNSYTVPSGNETYTTSGFYSDTLVNSKGCDSIISIDLTINYSSTGTDTQIRCDDFTWIDGLVYTASNTTATYTLTNSVGCDSIVTLDLTINSPSTGTDTQIRCDDFTWIDGLVYTASNTTATYTLTNSVGCDSIVTLNLTINSVNSSTTQNGVNLSANLIGASYQWLNCDNGNTPIAGETNSTFTAFENGNFAVEITQNGCSETSACMSVTTVGLNEFKVISGIKIFPNPTSGEVTISYENMQDGHPTLQLLDATGRVLSNQLMNENSTFLDLKSYEDGVYIIRITNGLAQSIHRVMKQ